MSIPTKSCRVRRRRPGLPDLLLRRLVEADEHGVVVEVPAVGVIEMAQASGTGVRLLGRA